jgi:protein-S-isoprenylcysteine O-methyltransferase Ste14
MAVFQVRVQTGEGRAHYVAEKLRNLTGIVEATDDRGGRNISAKVESKDLHTVASVLENIRGVEGVVDAEIVLPMELTRRGTNSPHWFSAVTYIVYPLLWILPSATSLFGWTSFGFLASIPSIELPSSAVLLALGTMIILQGPAIYANYLRVKDGGCQDQEDTAVLITRGPYSIVRHPSTIGGLALILLLPMILNGILRYTALAMLGQVLIFAIVVAVQVPTEEEFSSKKWGQAYLNYERSVPRFNILLGLWRLRQRRSIL